MKKHLQNLLIASALTFSVTALAQPTLTGANINPTLGEITTSKTTTIGVAQGSAGANQTWNLSGLGAGTPVTTTVVSVASTPSAASFPSANIAFYDGSSYAYYNNTATSWLNQGNTAGGVLFTYSNPETILSFPINFNSTYSDGWQCTFTSGNLNFTRTGTTTVTADGYGTVTTPANTYTNAMRLHFVQTYTDVSTSFTISYVNDEYLWFTPGVHTAIATTFTVTNSTFPTPNKGGSYFSGPATGLNSFNQLVQTIDLFPNPTSNEINLNFNSIESGKASLKIYDIAGKQLRSINELPILPGENNVNINTSEFPTGVYFMNINVNGILQKNERFVITH